MASQANNRIIVVTHRFDQVVEPESTTGPQGMGAQDRVIASRTFVPKMYAVEAARRREIFRTIQGIVGADLPALALVTIPAITVQNTRVRRLFNSIDPAAGDFSKTWLAPE